MDSAERKVIARFNQNYIVIRNRRNPISCLHSEEMQWQVGL